MKPAPFARNLREQLRGCTKCQTHRQQDLRRNGHYQRSLTVREGTIPLRMPLVRCRCGGYVEIPWQTVDKRARYWLDVELDVELDVHSPLSGGDVLSPDGGCQQYDGADQHQPSAIVADDAGGWGQAEVTGADLAPCPHSVVLDEAHISLGGESLFFMIAVADDGRPLAVRGPAQRTTDNWQALVAGLTERGISPLPGLVGVTANGDSAMRAAVHLVWPRVVIQQCVWHILERVADDVAKVYGRTAPEVEHIVGQAAHIFLRHPERPDAELRAGRRLTAFLVQHRGTAWVQTVSRAFAEGTEYLRTPGLQRTNGAAERLIKDMRRRTRPMDGCKSEEGAEHIAVVWRVWKTRLLRMNQEQAELVGHRHHNLKICHTHPKLA